MSVEQKNVIVLAQSGLTYAQKELIEHCKRAELHAHQDLVSSRGKGPSRKKGKGRDLRNDIPPEFSDTKTEEQEALWKSFAIQKKHE